MCCGGDGPAAEWLQLPRLKVRSRGTQWWCGASTPGAMDGASMMVHSLFGFPCGGHYSSPPPRRLVQPSSAQNVVPSGATTWATRQKGTDSPASFPAPLRQVSDTQPGCPEAWAWPGACVCTSHGCWTTADATGHGRLLCCSGGGWSTQGRHVAGLHCGASWVPASPGVIGRGALARLGPHHRP